MAQRRKKKAPAKNIRGRHLTRALQFAGQRMLYIGSSNRKLSACFKNTLRLQIKYNPKNGDRDYVLAATTMLDELRFFERDWHSWIGCYYDNGKERWVETLVLKIENHTLVDISRNTDDIFKQAIEECGTEHFVGYAFALTPADYYDLEKMSDGLSDMFVDNDIFDVNTHLPEAQRAVGEYALAEAVFGNNTLIRYVSQLVAVEKKMDLMEETKKIPQRRDLIEEERLRRIEHAKLNECSSDAEDGGDSDGALHGGSDVSSGDREGSEKVVHHSLKQQLDSGLEL